MPIDEFVSFQKNAIPQKRLEMQLAIHCAPLIKGRKIANIMTINEKDCYHLKRLLDGTSISECYLKTKGSQIIVYMYREKWLEGYLHSKQVYSFLQESGYSQWNVTDMLTHLSSRIGLFRNGELDFPHEIGLFLGYPLSDVKGFLYDRDGSKCKYTGYWKVYDNVNSKMRLFAIYDEMRSLAVSEILSGKTIKEISV